MEDQKKQENDTKEHSDKKIEDKKTTIEKTQKELFIENITEKFNLAFIPLDVVEDKRIYIEKVPFMDEFVQVEKNVDDPNLDLFYRGIIYGTQVVLRKILNTPLKEEQIKVINKLMNIDELEDDLSVSLIHGICFEYQLSGDIERINDDGSASPVFLVREWIKGKSFWKFRASKADIGKSDLLSILYSLARIIEHYHKYSLPYIFLRPKKIIVGSEFSVVLNDIIKLNSLYFNNKIRKQLVDKIKIVDQNRFLHPLLFYYAKYDESLKIKMFELYQSFDLYSFGCMCYLFYFYDKKERKLPWNKLKTYSDIFESYYGQSFENFKNRDEDGNSYKIYLPPQTKEGREKIIKSFFDEDEYVKYMAQKDENKDNYDIKLLKIVINCICPEIDNIKKEFSLKYTMKSAVEELLKIDCVKKFKKSKEFNYNFQNGNKQIIIRL